MHVQLLFIVNLLLFAVSGNYASQNCHESCYDNSGKAHCTGPTESDCQASCPVYYEGDEPSLVLGGVGLYVSDADQNEIFQMQSAVVEIFPHLTNDFDTILLNATYLVDGVLAEYSPEEGVLFIDGSASVSTYQAILNNVDFTIQHLEPDPVDRIICYTIFDGEDLSSEPSCITVKIEVINDNTPSFNFTAVGEPYVEEQGVVYLLDTLEITDVDHPEIFPMQSATISVTGWCGSSDYILVNTTGTNIQQITEGPCVNLTGEDTIENYTKVFLSARYDNTADEPDVSNRTIVFTLFDGDNEGVFNITLDLIPVDDHSTEIILIMNNVNISELDASDQYLLGNLTVFELMDEDTNDDVYINQMIVEILNASDEEFLTVLPHDFNISINGNGTSYLTITGRYMLIVYEDLLNEYISYGYESEEPPCPRDRMIRFTIEQTSTDLGITLQPVNDNAPVINTRDSVVFTENQPLRPLQDINITDADEFCISDSLYSSRIELFNYSSTETLNFAMFSWLYSDPSVCNNTLHTQTPSSDELMSNTAPIYYSNCQTEDNTSLILVAKGEATINQYLILLQSVVYDNNDQEPSPEDTNVLQVSVNDGIYDSDNVTVTIYIEQLNDEPPRVDTNGADFNFIEEQGPVEIVGSNATFTDEDYLIMHQTVTHFCVEILYPQSGDELLAPSLNYSYIFEDTDTRLCINVTSCDNDFPDYMCFNHFLRAVMFNNSLDEPAVVDRSIEFTAYDNFNNLNSTSLVTVHIISVNDKEHVLYLNGVKRTINYLTNFTEQGERVFLSRNLLIEDDDSGVNELTEAVISIQDTEDGDYIYLDWSLVVSANLSSGGNNTHIMISGLATQQTYESILATTKFNNTADEPTPPNVEVNRTILFSVSDNNYTVDAFATVTLEPVNDPPIIPEVTVTFNETTREPVYLFDTPNIIDDSDHDVLVWITLEIDPPLDSLDNLTIPDADYVNISRMSLSAPHGTCFPFINNHTIQSINISGPANKSVFNDVLHRITFSNDCPGIILTQRSIRITLFDGVDIGYSWLYVKIQKFNDSPLCYFGAWPGEISISTTYFEERPPVDLAVDFTLTDLDGPVAYSDIVTVNISNQRDENEEELGFQSSEGILITQTEYAVESNGYTSVYELSNGSSYYQYLKVLRTMTYLNKAREPSIYLPRLVTISINNTYFTECSVNVIVDNTPDRPVVTVPNGYSASYVEDSGIALILNTDITISDEDNTYLCEARFEILDTPVDYNFSDSLYILNNFTGTFNIIGNGTSSIIASGISTLIQHSFFEALIRSVGFQTTDQATNLTRQVSFTVEEHPLGDTGPSDPVNVSVLIVQVNDRPVLLDTPFITEDSLDDYLPSERNTGIVPSYLVNSSIVSDPDTVFPSNHDFIGLAIYSINNNETGYWQYWWEGSWVNVYNVSECYPLFISENQRIRFLPTPSSNKQDGSASLYYRIWDGTSSKVCTNGSIRTDEEVSVSSEMASFTYNIFYINRPPRLNINEYTFSVIREDEVSEDGDVSSKIASSVATDDDNVTSLSIIYADHTNGVWQYKDYALAWEDFPQQLNSSNALHLSPYSVIRFIPNNNYFGSSSLTAYIWDLSNNYTNTSFIGEIPSPPSPSGAYSNSTINLNINIVSVNDLPILSLNEAPVTFTESGSPVPVFQSLTITDVDSTDLENAYITLECPLCAVDNDSDTSYSGSGIPLTSESSDSLVSLHGNSFQSDDTYSGSTVTILISPIYYSSISAFQQYLRSLNYVNKMDEPGTADRIITLYVTDSMNISNTISVTVNIEQVNDPPVAVFRRESLQYIGQLSGKVSVAPNATITDSDNANLTGLRINLTANINNFVYDILEINDLLIPYGVEVIYDISPVSVSVIGDAPIEDYIAILRSLTYENNDTPGSPELGVRTLIVTPIGVGTGDGISDLLYINFNEINNPPILDLNGINEAGHDFTVTFTEESNISVYLLAENFVLLDNDTAELAYINITLEPYLNIEMEYIQITPFPSDIHVSQIAPNILYLRGTPTAPVSSFRDALSSLTYINTADEPIGNTRSIVFIVSDGSVLSNPVTTTVNVKFINDRPVLKLNGSVTNSFVMYIENGVPVYIAPNPVITDDDNDVTFTGLRLQATRFPGDIISGSLFNESGSYQQIFFNNITLSDLEDVIRSLSFMNTQDEPPAGEREYCLSVYDGELWSIPACAKIVFVPINDNRPVFTQDVYNTSIQENLENSEILQLIATDDDEFNSFQNFSWSVIAGDDCHDIQLNLLEYNCRFYINDDGELFTTDTPPDREIKSLYTLTVVVSDNNFADSSTTIVTIVIEDENDNPPVFSGPFSGSIEENSPVDSFVLSVSATDEDEGSNAVVNFIIKGSPILPFTLDKVNGDLRVNNSIVLDREVQESYEITILAYNPFDITGPSAETTITIIITDINDNPPLIHDLTINIDEDFTPNSDPFSGYFSSGYQRYITTITANDSDAPFTPNSNITYSIQGGSGISIFFIDATSGAIYANSLLDREDTDSYTLFVVAMDDGNPVLSSNVTIEIIINDVNDNPPIFSMVLYTNEVSEILSIGSEILIVMATDLDDGLNKEIRYSIVEQLDVPFEIDDVTGSITLATTLDRETQIFYSFSVTAYDLGSPSFYSTSNVTIRVLDANDHPPMIQLLFQTSPIPENSPIGTIVAKFIVTDNDENLHAVSILYLSGDNELFNVNQTGVVTVSGILDYEIQTVFNIVLIANNTAFPYHNSVYPFSIEITNINDNAPIIIFNTPEVSFAEGSDYAVVLNVGITIVDPDGRNFTSIHDAKVEFIDLIETSYPFIPTSFDDPSTCPLEDKREKMFACGLSVSGTQTILPPSSEKFNLLGGLSFNDEKTTLIFDANEQQFAEDRASLNNVLSEDTLSMLTWIWYTPTSTASTIFVHVMENGIISYGAICHNGNDLEFLYSANGSQKSIMFSGTCSLLVNQWHHLALVTHTLLGDPHLSVYIDGYLYTHQSILQPEDSEGRLYLGARPQTGDDAPMQDYFTGRLHRMVISSSVITEHNINCIIGCGVYLYSSSLIPLVPYQYNYTEKHLLAQDIRDIELYEEFLDTLIFVIAFREPRQLRYNLDYTVTDGGFNCIPVQLNISIEPSNDGDPVLSLNGAFGVNFSSIYIEEAGPVLIVNSSSLTLTDVDLVPFPYIINATITNPKQSASYEVLDVLILPGMTKEYSSYTLTIKGMFTITNFQTVLRTLTYDNLADEPVGTSRTVNIKVYDPLEGPRESNDAYSHIAIQYVNDAPILVLESNDVVYLEGDGFIPVLIGLDIMDSDNDTLVSATVSFNAFDGDLETLTVDKMDSNISVTFTITSQSSILTLTGEDNLTVYLNILGSLMYENNMQDNITAGDRVFNFILFDGISNSEVQTSTLFIQGVNDIPIINLNGTTFEKNYSTIFIEGSQAVAAVSETELSITDVDSKDLESAEIRFISRPDGSEEIVFINSSFSEFELENNGSLYILSHKVLDSAPIAEFQSVLRTLKYLNTAEEPSPGIHTLQLTVFDGKANSSPAYISIDVIGINDPPYIDLDSNSNGTGFSNTYEEEGPSVSISSSSVEVTDNDIDASINTVLVVIKNPQDGSSERILSIDSNVNITILQIEDNEIQYSISLLIGSLDYTESLISSLNYTNELEEPTPGVRSVEVSLFDGVNYSNVAIAEITVVIINDHAPIFAPLGTQHILENVDAYTTIFKVSATDADSGIAGLIIYSISDVYPSVGIDRFTIDNETGLVQTLSPLDREEVSIYILTVQATDQGNTPLNTITNITVVVLDENDNDPMFSQDVYVASVSELAIPGDIVITAVANDPDLPINFTFFEMQGTGGMFIVQPNGDITVGVPLDADVPNPVYNITVLAMDSGGRYDSAVFIITILDENDNIPIFDSQLYLATVPENTLGAIVVTVSASDIDSTSNAELSYSFAEASQNFQIDEVTGLITTNKLLDREKQEMYEIIVLAVDSGSLQQTGSATVQITLLDINDNAPMFEESLYIVSISESVGGGTTIIRVMAIDLDNGLNGSITYSISQSDEMPFGILGQTGDIFVQEPLDFESVSVYNISVIATDNGATPLSSTSQLTVYIEDANDNKPQFIGLPYLGEVPENAFEYSILFVAAVDLDSGSNAEIRYKLDNHNDFFSINETSGEIITAQGLDFEEQCFYVLSVIAFDLGEISMTSIATVDITVIPLNDHPPTFNQSIYYADVLEDSNTETFIAQVKAVDDDQFQCEILFSGSGDSSPDLLTYVTYSLLNYNDVFEIDLVSAVISTISTLDRETVSQYTLIVSAADMSGVSSNASVIVTIGDINDNEPKFTMNSYEQFITENLPEGTPVLQVIATDEDILDAGKIRYRLLDHPAFFGIYEETGLIYASDVIDFENSEETYSFFVIAEDTAFNLAIAQVIIHIINTNDIAPSIDTLSMNLTFVEGQINLSPFPVISITDIDSFQLSNAQITLISPNPIGNVNSNCYCSDSTNASTCTLGCLEFIQIKESVFPGIISQSEDGYTLSLSGNFSIATYEFAIEAVEYINLISNPLPDDRSISLTVNDGVLPSNTLTNTIQMILLNQFAPVLDLNGLDQSGFNYVVNFTEEGEAVSIVSPNVSITDADMVNNVEEITGLDVWIVNPEDGNNEEVRLLPGSLPGYLNMVQSSPHRLSITGVSSTDSYITILKQIEYINTAPEPSTTLRQVNIQVHEYHLSSNVTSAFITIITFNDHPPVALLNPPMNNYDTEYRETSPPIRIVSSYAFIDDDDSSEDPLTQMQVAIISPGEFDQLSVDDANISSDIHVTQISATNLLFEGSSSLLNYQRTLVSIYYSFSAEEFTQSEALLQKFIFVQITDNDFSSFSITRVKLIPENDQQPQFTKPVYIEQLSEDTAVGYTVLQLDANDGDTFTDSQMQFSITAGDENDLFNLSMVSGVITLAKELNFEENQVHVLTVQVEDLLYETGVEVPSIASVEITVGDRNDNIPQFNQSQYNGIVGEGVPIGTSVLQVYATDADSSNHSQLIFGINGTTDFIIDSAGVVRTAANIDRENVANYVFSVTVRNPGSNQQDTASINIEVLDFDDNSPVISLTLNFTILQEPNTQIVLAQSLSITDTDPLPSLDNAVVSIVGSQTPGILITPLVAANGVLVAGNGTKLITFSGVQTLFAYESILQSVIYIDSSEEPADINRNIMYQVFSGDTSSNEAIFTILIETINDQSPVIVLSSANASYYTIFTENGPPVKLSDDSLTISDSDSGENMITFAVVELLVAPDGDYETLSITPSRGLFLDPQTNTRLVLKALDFGSHEDFEIVLKTVRYENTAKEPTTTTRLVTFIVNDGLFNSAPAVSFIDIESVNDAPVITLGQDSTVDVIVIYDEGQDESLVLAPLLEIQDVDSDMFTAAIVLLADITEEEMISITSLPEELTQTSGNGQIKLFASSGVSSSVFEEALRSVSYSSTRETPFSIPREVLFIIVDDFGSQSLPATARITFNSSDDIPILDLNGPLIAGLNYTVTYIEEMKPIQIVSPNATIVDVDSDVVANLTVTILAMHMGDEFFLPSQIEGLTRSQGQNNREFVYSGIQSISVYEELLHSITYANELEESSPISRRVLFQVYTPVSGNGHTSTSNVAESTIYITSINDQPPVFGQDIYYGDVYENQEPGTSVGVVVEAMDLDIPSNENIIYFILGGSTEFQIDSSSGAITTLIELDADVLPSNIDLVVVAEDSDLGMVHTATAIVNISIGDLNDNTPVFSQPSYTISVSEAIVLDTIILQVLATDDDQLMENSAVNYVIYNDTNIPFLIDDFTGVITISQTLDFEMVEDYIFIVTASDGTNNAEVTVTINITDVNDNAPVFIGVPYNFEISETTQIGMFAFSVYAEDNDSGSNGKLTFSIIGTELFDINSSTGDIYVAAVIDYELQQYDSFIVIAVDNGDVPLLDEAVVNITITNHNDNPPSFDQSIYYFSLPENTEFDLSVHASDLDNDILSYTIIKSCAEIFTIDSLTGQIYSLESLDREVNPMCVLLVNVSDGVFTDQTIVNITVNDENDNAPEFDLDFYSVTVPEILPIGNTIVTVHASDIDFGNNAIITYSLISGNVDNTFNISSLTGAVILASSVDYEYEDYYLLTVQAQDNGMNPLTGIASIAISIINNNDESPVVSFNTPNISYAEESGALFFAVEVGLKLSDEDDTFPMQGAIVSLKGENDNIEEIIFSFTPLPPGMVVTGNNTFINISGEATIETYQTLLYSIYYINTASEPTPGSRTLMVTVSDGQQDTITILNINVVLLNDNMLKLSSDIARHSFIEGNTSLSIGEDSGLTIMDSDEDALVYSLSIVLASLEAEKEFISVEGFGSILNDSYEIKFNQTASITTYQTILSSLSYTYLTNDEPLPGERNITITASDGMLPPVSLQLIIEVQILNNNAPQMSFAGKTTVTYNETDESSAVLAVGSLMQPVISDADNNDVFFMNGAIVNLVNAVDEMNEQLGIAGSLPTGIQGTVNGQNIILSGSASVLSYQQALRTVTYQNNATEPTRTNRQLTFQVFDELLSSNVVEGTITIALIDDNEFVLVCGSEPQVFTEGSSEAILISPGLSLTDLDADHSITGAEISITNPNNGDELNISTNSELTVTKESTVIYITRNAQSIEYQALLQTLSYISTADEPAAETRVVAITVYQSSISVNCSILVYIQLVNDNEPVVDLSGPTDDGINYTAVVSYIHLSPARVSIASDDAVITDADVDSKIMSLDVNLDIGRDGDRLVLDPSLCGTTLEEDTCYLNIPLDEPVMCSCGVELEIPTDVVIKFTVTSISISQSGNVTNNIIQMILRQLIFFQHSPSRPDSSYMAEVSVNGSDGILTSEIATTTVMVEFQNFLPTVYVDGQSTFADVEIVDGQTDISITPLLSIMEDTNTISQMTIQLKNFVHVESESIFFTSTPDSGIELSEDSNATFLILTGEATISAYTTLLRSLIFKYTRMESLLEQQPNTEDRIITITAVDSEGGVGQESIVTVVFSLTCTVWSGESPIEIPSDISLDKLSICTSVPNYGIRVTGNVDSLKPLTNLQSVDTLSLINLPDLETLEGLENFGSFSELVVDNADSLTTMEQLGANMPQDYRITIQSVAVRNSPKLTNIDGLRIVQNVTNLIQLQSCDELRNLSGFRNLVSVGTIFIIQLPVTEITYFDNLFSASDLWIYRNYKLETITGFQNLRSLEMLNIITNPNLRNIDGLSGLLSVTLVRTFMNTALCYVGTSEPSEVYWQNLGAHTLGDFVTASCPIRLCTDQPCLNNAECMDVANPVPTNSYTCTCSDDYFGSSCQFFNECSTNPCQNGGSCSPYTNSETVKQYTCLCPIGTTGFDCETLA